MTVRCLVTVCAMSLGTAVAGYGSGPQLSPATGARLVACVELAPAFRFANTTITSAEPIAAATLKWGAEAIGAHCLVKGEMYRRTSAQDGKSYAIGFEMRLPEAWNGRFFYQANGGLDGRVTTALGGGGPVRKTALQLGFAVLSSDAGHAGGDDPSFGIDFQARLDYGYQAVAKLTPMAKSLITSAYGKPPDRSYFGGCSNGGRHTFVAMTRMPREYDGYLAGAPGYRLPLAAIANQFGAKRYATLSRNPSDLGTAFTSSERAALSAAVLRRCDALDGADDGIIQDTTACQAAFKFERDVPTCSGERDGTCLSATQQAAIAPIFSGAVRGDGSSFYASFPFDSGHASQDSSFWEFLVPLRIDSAATAIVWAVPPADPQRFDGTAYALSMPIDEMLAAVAATDATYTESGLAFMQPVKPTDLAVLRDRGAKVIVYHGVSDAIFSVNDTTTWYEGLQSNTGGDAASFARYFRVPGMAHCGGGPSTDQFDMLSALVDWVENGRSPDIVIANARGPGNAIGVNPDVPSGWSPHRSRPLCSYPEVARLRVGATDMETADSFTCERPAH